MLSVVLVHVLYKTLFPSNKLLCQRFDFIVKMISIQTCDQHKNMQVAATKQIKLNYSMI